MSGLNLSERAVKIPASPIRKLASYADEAKSKGIEVFHLNIGQPDIHTPDIIFNAMRNFGDNVLSYGPSQGLKDLREEMSKYYKRFNIDFDPSEISVTQGGSEAIIFAMEAVCNHGDQIIVFEPFYTNYLGFSIMAGIELVPVQTSVKNGFRLPEMSLIQSKITERTKAILICSPNNPTGTVYSKVELESVMHIAEKNDLYILSDEVYREFVFDGKKHTSIMDIKNAEKRAVVLDSISKRFSMCGARIGFLSTKISKLNDVFLKFSQARLCPATVEQVGVIAALKHYDEFMNDMIDEYEDRRDIVYREINEIDGVFTLKPEGAFYCVVELPIDDAEDFAKYLLTDFSYQGQTTMVSPANGFYATAGKGKNEIRIAYVLGKENLIKSIRILKRGLDSYKK